MSRIAPTGSVRQREPRVRDKVHLGKIARLPCIACLVAGRTRLGVHCAHVRASYPDEPGWREVGKAEKPSDHRCLALCPDHHMHGPDAQHRSNEKLWYERLGIFPPHLCAALVEAFARGEDGLRVCQAFAHDARLRKSTAFSR